MPADAELEQSRRGAPAMLVARRSLVIAGVERRYLLAVPPEYDPDRPYPLVFGFHGSGGDREQLRRYMNVETPAAGQAVFVYPEGLNVDDRGTGWSLSNDSDDLAFVDGLLAKYTGELCIDERAIFATGHSFGGCMSNTVGCYRGEAFRAIAPVAGCSGGGGRNTSCSGRIAALLIHSPKDTSTRYRGAIGACTRYLRANSCDEMPATAASSLPRRSGAAPSYHHRRPTRPMRQSRRASTTTVRRMPALRAAADTGRGASF
jgi:poly(3-hydroxybutyrate) depolymerase